MTDLKTNTACAALIALLAAAPVTAFAIESGSPQQSVAADPDEYAVDEVTGESLEDTAKADQGEDAYEDADVVEDTDGSLIKDDAKRDG